MQLQFANDDDFLWQEKFGNGSAGVLSAPYGITVDLISGTAGAYTATAGSASVPVGSIVFIHQTQGAIIASIPNNWQLNVLISNSGGVAQFKYPLTQSWSNAQMIYMPQWDSANVSNAYNWNITAWSGAVYGVFPIMVRSVGIFHNSFYGQGQGFRGYPGVGHNTVGREGEGYLNNNGNQVQVSNTGNGGGAGGYSDNSPWNQGNGGAGGSGYTQGQYGSGTGGGNNSHGGAGASPSGLGDNRMKRFSLGGAGGEGGDNNNSGSNSGGGGNGGACLFIFCPYITQDGTINLQGNSGGTADYTAGCGGSGAGGSFGVKCINGSFANILTSGGAHVRNRNHTSVDGDSDGGYGGNGTAHVDYSGIVSGIADTRYDPSYNSFSAAVFMPFL